MNPLSQCFKIWDFVLILAQYLYFIIVVYSVSNEMKAVHNWSYLLLFDCCIDLLFLVDFGLHFCFAFYNKNGDKVVQCCPRVKHYLHSAHFPLDIIPCLPVSYFFVQTELFQYLRLIKVLRFKKQLQWLSNLNLTFQVKYYLKVATYILYLAIFILTCAALWVLQVKSECQWLILIQNLTQWQSKPFCSTYSPSFQYWAAVVYSNILVVSHGQAFPTSQTQIVLGCLYLLLGSFVEGILFGMIINSIELAKFQEGQFHKEYDYIISFSNSLNLGKMQTRHFHQLMYGSTLSAFLDSELSKFLNMLPPSLHRLVVSEVIIEKFKNSLILESLPNLEKFFDNIELSFLIPEEGIFSYKEDPDGVYFVIRGSVELLSPNIKQDSFRIMKFLKPGSFFGEIGCLMNTSRSQSARCSRFYSTIAYLSLDNLKIQLKEIEQAARKLKRNILQYEDPLVKVLRRSLENCGVVHYKKGEYLWKAGADPKGIWILLRGRLIFTVDIAGLLVPLKIAKNGSILGLDHYLAQNYYQSYLHCQTDVCTAFISKQELDQARCTNPQLRELMLRHEENMQDSTVRPYPLDQGLWNTKHRLQFAKFVFKNAVVKVVRQVRKERHLSFLMNIKEEMKAGKEQLRAKKHRQFLLKSLRDRKRQFKDEQVNQDELALQACIMSSKEITKKIDSTIRLLSLRTSRIRDVDRVLNRSIKEFKQKEIHLAAISPQLDLMSKEEEKDEVFSISSLKRNRIKPQISRETTFNLSEAYLPSDSLFSSSGIKTINLDTYKTLSTFHRFESEDKDIEEEYQPKRKYEYKSVTTAAQQCQFEQ